MYISSDRVLDKNKEINHFNDILNFKSSVHAMQTVERWDERAQHWEKSLLKKTEEELNTPRITELVSFLKNKNVLNKNTSVLDVGGGVGVVSLALAKEAKNVLVMDFSKEMCRVGRSLASSKNQTNIDFLEADFFTFNVNKMKFKNKFDLVFSSLSPSIKYGGIDKCISLSASYFCNESFVSREVDLYTKLEEDVFNVKHKDTFDGHWSGFYAMSNLLFLEGYYPEITYIGETEEHTVSFNDEIITDAMIFLSRTIDIENNTINRKKIKDYIYQNATIINEKPYVHYKSSTVYGIALIDVRKKDLR